MKLSNNQAPEPLWLALRFPWLPLEALGHAADGDEAIAIAWKRQICCCSQQARAQGLQIGSAASSVQLQQQACRVYEREPQQEQACLERLRELANHYSPHLQIYRHNSVLLEISGSLKLFGGLASLCQQLRDAVAELGPPRISCETGLAHSPRAAWILSYCKAAENGGDPDTPPSREEFLEQLGRAPLHYLADYPAVVERLQKTGFQSIADLCRQSRASLRRRFGNDFVDYLNDVLGCDEQQQAPLFRQPKPLYLPTETFEQHRQFDYPVDSVDHLRPILEQLCEQLSLWLIQHQRQCHAIRWRLADIYQQHHDISVRCSPVHRHWQQILDLTLIQLEQQQLPFAVDRIELICSDSAPLSAGSDSCLSNSGQLDPHTQAKKQELLFARLHARLGTTALYKLSYVDQHIPEQAQEKIPADARANQSLPPAQRASMRPCWIFNPEPVQQRGGTLYWHGALQLLHGPERIDSGWWQQGVARDYYVARRGDNLRCWLFQERRHQTWFVQGIF